jgi:molybdate transport system substrate-binding protein
MGFADDVEVGAASMRRHALIQPALVIVLAFALPAVSHGQIKVLMSGGFSVAYQELLPEFEKATGISVATARGASQGDGPDTIGAQLRRGVSVDMVIMNREGLEALITEGRVASGTVVDIAHVPLGLAVRHGATRPDIGSVTAFRQRLLQARSVSSDSSAFIYITTKLLAQLGVAGTVTSKVVNQGAPAVARGESDFVILPVSELLNAPGVDFIGAIPAEVQHVSVFTAGIVAGAKEPEASKRLIAFLTSENATAAIRKSGMEPSK